MRAKHFMSLLHAKVFFLLLFVGNEVEKKVSFWPHDHQFEIQTLPSLSRKCLKKKIF